MLGNGVASDASMTAMSLPNQNRARNKIGLFGSIRGKRDVSGMMNESQTATRVSSRSNKGQFNSTRYLDTTDYDDMLTADVPNSSTTVHMAASLGTHA